MFEKGNLLNRQQKRMVGLLAGFTAKFGLAFVVTLEDALS